MQKSALCAPCSVEIMPISAGVFPYLTVNGRVRSVSTKPGMQALTLSCGFSRAMSMVYTLSTALDSP
eukprot:scaffold6259_cov122-Isochrysis_galbana.AAC.5